MLKSECGELYRRNYLNTKRYSNGFIVHGAVLNSSKEQIGELYAETQAETTRRSFTPKHRSKRWNCICIRPVRWEYPQQATSSCAHFNAAVDAALAAAAAKAALRRDVVVWADLEELAGEA